MGRTRYHIGELVASQTRSQLLGGGWLMGIWHTSPGGAPSTKAETAATFSLDIGLVNAIKP